VLVTLAGCKPPSQEGEGRFAAPRLTEAPGTLVRSKRSHGPAPAAPEADLKALAQGNREFECALYHELAASDGNLVFSPLSISVAMAMAYAGARGETEKQLAEALHFALPQDRLHPALNRLDQSLKPASGSRGQGLELHVLNALWAQKGETYVARFLDTLATNYDTGVHEMDFEADAEGARKAINEWASSSTGSRIRDLIGPGVLGVNTRLVLTNAAYFRAEWVRKFAPDKTKDEPFHRLTGKPVSAKMMHQTGEFPYLRGDGYAAVGLPYHSEQQSMVAILPDSGSFAAAQDRLSGEEVAMILEGLATASVHVGLPRFEFDAGAELTAALKALGATDAFSDERADFSGMSKETELFVTAVPHKAFISVNEERTEAAAATAVAMEGKSAEPPEPALFIADRPFVFLIVDRATGAILFMGRVMDPTA